MNDPLHGELTMRGETERGNNKRFKASNEFGRKGSYPVNGAPGGRSEVCAGIAGSTISKDPWGTF